MRRIFLVALVFAIAAPAFAEERGIIQCMGLSQVPAGTEPGGTNVIEQLACGQMVSVIGLERGYAKIQIGERVACVNAKYVRLPQTQKPLEPVYQQAHPESPAQPSAPPQASVPPPPSAPPSSVPSPPSAPPHPKRQCERNKRSS